MMVVVVLVVFCYFGGKYCPSVLKQNKTMLLGVAGGLVLCSFFGMRLEGFTKLRECCGDLEALAEADPDKWAECMGGTPGESNYASTVDEMAQWCRENRSTFGGASSAQGRSTLSHYRESGGGDLLRGSNVSRAVRENSDPAPHRHRLGNIRH